MTGADVLKVFEDFELRVPTGEERWEVLRSYRNKLLKESDYTQLDDVDVDKQAWKKYRKDLRDITEGFENVDDVIIPDKPSE